MNPIPQGRQFEQGFIEDKVWSLNITTVWDHFQQAPDTPPPGMDATFYRIFQHFFGFVVDKVGHAVVFIRDDGETVVVKNERDGLKVSVVKIDACSHADIFLRHRMSNRVQGRVTLVTSVIMHGY